MGSRLAAAGAIAGGTAMLMLACAPGGEQDFTDWTIPVPAATPVRSVSHVPFDDRSESLPLERDLLLEGAYDVPFYRVMGVAVSERGDLYVLDQGNERVVAFDSEGRARGLVGRAGNGPGEFQWPWFIAVTGGRIYLHSPRLARLNEFALAGGHIADYTMPGSFRPTAIVRTGGRRFGVDAQEPMVIYGGAEPRPAPWILGEYSAQWELETALVEFEVWPRAYWSSERSAGETPVREPRPRAAISEGHAYVTDGREYQVLAMTLEGDPVWALRGHYTAPAPSEKFKQALMGSPVPDAPASRRYPTDPALYVWPDRFATIENLEVDGRGNLYVFPHAGRSAAEWQEIHRPVPVDVYTPGGQRLFSGWSAIDGWDAALGDHVYRVERDPETQESIVARYRLRF